MKNKLTDLNNHLFAQIERLSEEKIKPDQLNLEIDRAKSMSIIAKDVVEVQRLALKAQQVFSDMGDKNKDMPKMLT